MEPALPKGYSYFFPQPVPLPSDYNDLSPERQKLERLRVLTSWYDPKDPRLITDPQAFIWAFRLFKQYYRMGWKDNFPKYKQVSPPAHDEWTRMVAENPHLLLTASRGFGKSFWCGEELPEFLIVCRPNTPVQYTSAAKDLVEKQVRAVKLDIERNDLIRRDFGELKPSKRGTLKWTNSRIELTNGSSFLGISSDSRQRGTTQLSLRALCQILDDPEVDLRVKNPELIEDFDDFLFNIFFPCAEPGAWRIWANTLLSPHAWATKAREGSDVRFKNWKAVKYDVLFKDELGNWKSLWPERWPVDKLLKMAGLLEAEEGEAVVNYGWEAFSTEFLNDPKMKGTCAFAYDPSVHDFHYEVDKDGRTWVVEHLTKKRRLLKDLLDKGTRVMGIDISLARTSFSDLSAVVNAVIDEQGILWVLHAWTDRKRPSEVGKLLFEFGKKWNSEYLGLQKSLLELTLLDFLNDELSARMMDGRYLFNICELAGMGRQESKTQHILSLQWRFVENKIRIVSDVVQPEDPTCTLVMGSGSLELVNQISTFTQKGAPKYDDLLDALVFCQDVGLIAGRGNVTPAREETLLEQVAAAKELGLPVVAPRNSYSVETLLKLQTKNPFEGYTGELDHEQNWFVVSGGADVHLGSMYEEVE